MNSIPETIAGRPTARPAGLRVRPEEDIAEVDAFRRRLSAAIDAAETIATTPRTTTTGRDGDADRNAAIVEIVTALATMWQHTEFADDDVTIAISRILAGTHSLAVNG